MQDPSGVCVGPQLELALWPAQSERSDSVLASHISAALIGKTAPAMILDLFAGPGGWSQGLRELGMRELGIDNHPAACATARAAGHERVQADIADADPESFGPVWGLVASPPCQGFAKGGKRLGLRDRELVLGCLRAFALGYDWLAEMAAHCDDPRSMLVLEPLRWALDLRPRWIVLEQVSPVQVVWRGYQPALERVGYSTWVGVLDSETFGLPQTRKRAFLLASLDGPVSPPAATHRHYRPRGEPKGTERFLPAPPTMYDALGWGLTDRPARAVVARSGATGSPSALDSGSGVREMYGAAMRAGLWVDRPGRSAGDSIWARMRCGWEDAAVLQGFPPSYPWQGTERERHLQVGNAVPPLVARTVLAQVMAPTLAAEGRAA